MALAACGFTRGGFLGDEPFSQGVKIAAQDAQRQVTGKALFAAVARALQTVAGLQRSDGRFDARMTLPRRAPVQRRVLSLDRRLFGARLGQARPGDDLCQAR